MQVSELTKLRSAVKAKGGLSALGEILNRRIPAISNQPRLLGIGRAYMLGPERW